MADWGAFELAVPDLAAEGQRLFYQYGVGLGFLGTVRKDGGPRVHPICPIITAGGLYAFLGPSPKCADLRRDSRYALHSFPPEDVDDEFYVTGQVRELFDPSIRSTVAAAYHVPVQAEDTLFAFDIAVCMHAKYRQRGDWPPVYTKWADLGPT
jgi:hypothetical protein